MAMILGIILTFVFTIVIGNKITQSRQQDSWLAQQRFSGQEKEYSELRKLSQEIGSSLGARIYAMQRLALQLRSSDIEIDDVTIKDYKDAVKFWNENLNSYYIRLSQLNLSIFRYRLESELHIPIRAQSIELDQIISNRKSTSNRLRKILKALELANVSALRFNSDLLNQVKQMRDRIYFPKKLLFSRRTMRYFSTWQLIKAIFATDINSVSVFRSPIDP